MTIEEEVVQKENDEGVVLTINDNGRIAIKGSASAVDRVSAWLLPIRGEVAELLRTRQGLSEASEPVVTREISANIPSLEIQKKNYYVWAVSRGAYFTPSKEELEKMFSVLTEGDEIIFDFAHSVTVRRSSGLLVSVDRKGRISEPSPYSPAVRHDKGRNA